MLVQDTRKLTRDREIEQLIQQTAKQFGITDPLDLADLRQTIIEKINTSKALLDYTPSNRASSAHFRANVRNAFIDLIAYFVQIRDINAALRSTEVHSRNIFNQFEAKRKSMASLVQKEDTDLVRRETFTKEQTNGYYGNVYVNNGKLRLRMKDVNAPYKLRTASATVYPAANGKRRVIHSETGSITSILDVGVGSKLWSMDVYTPEQPEMYWSQSVSGSSTSEGANYLYQGIMVDVELKLTKPIQLSYIAAKFLTPTRLARVYVDTSGEGEVAVWEPILTRTGRFVKTVDYSRTLELFEFASEHSSDHIRLVFNVGAPETIVSQNFILDKMYDRQETFQGLVSNKVDFEQQQRLPNSFLYTLGIYNLRLRNRRPAYSHGAFISNPYPTKVGAVTGVELQTKDSGLTSGSQVYTAVFGHRSEMSLLPRGASRVIHELVNTDSSGRAILSFPAQTSVISPETYTIEQFGPTRAIIEVTDATGTPVTHTQNIPVIYTTYKSTKYAFIDRDFTQTSTQYGGDDSGICTMFIRVAPTYPIGAPLVSVYEALPVAVYNIRETFQGQSTIDLQQAPWIDIDGAYPIEVAIQPDPDDETLVISNLSHPDLVVDQTNYYNRSIQPVLENFGATERYEFFVRGSQVLLNTADYSRLDVNYFVKTSGAQLRIDQQAHGNLSPWVDSYTLTMRVQRN